MHSPNPVGPLPVQAPSLVKHRAMSWPVAASGCRAGNPLAESIPPVRQREPCPQRGGNKERMTSPGARSGEWNMVPEITWHFLSQRLAKQ